MADNEIIIGNKVFSLYQNISGGDFENDNGGILFITENRSLCHYYLFAGSYSSLKNINITELYKLTDLKKVNFCLLIENDQKKRQKLFEKILVEINKEKQFIKEEQILCKK